MKKKEVIIFVRGGLIPGRESLQLFAADIINTLHVTKDEVEFVIDPDFVYPGTLANAIYASYAFSYIVPKGKNADGNFIWGIHVIHEKRHKKQVLKSLFKGRNQPSWLALDRLIEEVFGDEEKTNDR